MTQRREGLPDTAWYTALSLSPYCACACHSLESFPRIDIKWHSLRRKPRYFRDGSPRKHCSRVLSISPFQLSMDFGRLRRTPHKFPLQISYEAIQTLFGGAMSAYHLRKNHVHSSEGTNETPARHLMEENWFKSYCNYSQINRVSILLLDYHQCVVGPWTFYLPVSYYILLVFARGGVEWGGGVGLYMPGWRGVEVRVGGIGWGGVCGWGGVGWDGVGGAWKGINSGFTTRKRNRTPFKGTDSGFNSTKKRPNTIERNEVWI